MFTHSGPGCAIQNRSLLTEFTFFLLVIIASPQYWKSLRLIVVDSIGSLFASIIGGNGLVGHSQLISAAHIMQVGLHICVHVRTWCGCCPGCGWAHVCV